MQSASQIETREAVATAVWSSASKRRTSITNLAKPVCTRCGGVSVEIQRSEFSGDHGSERQRQVDVHEHPWLFDRPSSGQYLLEGVDVSKHDKRALALIRNQKIGLFPGF